MQICPLRIPESFDGGDGGGDDDNDDDDDDDDINYAGSGGNKQSWQSS